MIKRAAYVTGLVVTIIGLMLLSFLPALQVRAAAGDNTGAIGFYVRAILPENQMNDSLTYFDLRMQPNQAQTLEVEVVNETDAPITVDIAAISASTNRNGVIDYKTPDIRDSSLIYPFSELAVLENSSLTVVANSTATARIAIAMPTDVYDGVVLGGLVFTRQPQPQVAESQDMALQNVYSYVIGVKLSETDVPVAPDFELGSVRGETVNYQPAMVHFVRNKAAAIAKDISLHLVVHDAAGQTVAEAKRDGIDMAPNSVMPLALDLLPQPDGQTQLRPGDYTSKTTLTHDDETWVFEEKFTIGSVEADYVNAETIGNGKDAATVQPRPDMRFPTLLLTLLISAALVILALFIIIVALLRRRAAEQEPQAAAKQPQKVIYTRVPRKPGQP